MAGKTFSVTFLHFGKKNNKEINGWKTIVRFKKNLLLLQCTFMPDSEGDFILRINVERYSNEVDDNEHTSTGAPLAIEQKIDSEIILPRPRSRNNGTLQSAKDNKS